MTIKELIMKNPNASFDLMTPWGYVFLTPETAQALLRGQEIQAHAEVRECSVSMPAEELLIQEVVNINAKDELFHVLTENPQEMEQDLEVKMC